MGWRRDWVQRKCVTVQALSEGAGDADYADAVLIICAILSRLSRELWPGRDKDRRRFIELLARIPLASPPLHTVSVPLLVEFLQASTHHAAATALASSFPMTSKSFVVTGEDIDRPETGVLAAVPSIDASVVRKLSYAALLYDEVRSPYMHEYSSGGKADSRPMTMLASARVSYINRIEDKSSDELERELDHARKQYSDEEMEEWLQWRETHNSVRRIHFHVGYLIDLAIAAAEFVDTTLDGGASPEVPSSWWIDG